MCKIAASTPYDLVPDLEDVLPAVATTGTTGLPAAPTARRWSRAATEAPFRSRRRSTDVGDAEADT